MPPPQCPECGRFLATAFVDRIRTEPTPCPQCGTELSLADDDAVTPEPAPAVPPPAATRPDDAPAGTDEALAADAEAEPASEPPDGEAVDEPEVAVPPPAATIPDDVEPEPETSVRPPDLQRDPLEGWDRTGTTAVAADEADPAVLAAGAGVGLVVGMLLGGREHRGLGALLGALLGAVVARLRG